MADGLILADRHLRELGYLAYSEGDFTIGVSNSFSLRVPPGSGAARGCYVVMDGSEWGGRIDGVEIDTAEDYATVTGRTWHGLLASSVLSPPAGSAHLVESGELNAVIGRCVERMGLGFVLAADPSDSGMRVDGFRFSRVGSEMDGYSQLRRMLRSAGAKLRIGYSPELRRAVLSAVPQADYSDDGMDGDRTDFVISEGTPVNHLHCLGTGEGAARAVLDLYADSRGRVSRVQTLTGAEHRCEVYDNPAADISQLEKYGTSHLLDMQGDLARCVLSGADEGCYDIDDIVGGASSAHGVSVTTTVACKIAVLDDGGGMTFETKTQMEV